MFGLFEEHHEQVYNGNHESKFSHEVVAGAASFAAVKMFEDKQRREGKEVSHAFAKEAIAALAGAEADKLFESKGLDYLDRDRVRNQAIENAQRGYDEHYGRQERWTPDSQPPFDYQRY
ncbi:conserved hypothetical protein [Candida tropicalis MYA-3404]|uniref:CipC-like antibiotic response protein n=1 Tax=Candida tropicalis (strain ATCC MYA-3404 / T1) TaxID=294747 RepID=C5MDI1_CANTT|nr:conserved hypothetical protein [Candida tropicalis MYA-3404]EER32062.1 conserved hypothetical protein [Candida tropicalis MYA-3404]KAG4405656.1 hypothetical protein JTP64_004526 [Candida tropicalis]